MCCAAPGLGGTTLFVKEPEGTLEAHQQGVGHHGEAFGRSRKGSIITTSVAVDHVPFGCVLCHTTVQLVLLQGHESHMLYGLVGTRLESNAQIPISYPTYMLSV